MIYQKGIKLCMFKSWECIPKQSHYNKLAWKQANITYHRLTNDTQNVFSSTTDLLGDRMFYSTLISFRTSCYLCTLVGIEAKHLLRQVPKWRRHVISYFSEFSSYGLILEFKSMQEKRVHHTPSWYNIWTIIMYYWSFCKVLIIAVVLTGIDVFDLNATDRNDPVLFECESIAISI